jgi:hypothetical protein
MVKSNDSCVGLHKFMLVRFVGSNKHIETLSNLFPEPTSSKQ